jgi:hydroxymethylbilane synthase
MSLLLPAVNKMGKLIRIGTRESQLAVWQATEVKKLLAQNGFASELVYIKSEGDIDLKTPLYEMGVQGVFTRSLDIALLNDTIDIAVHSMKDVPTQLAKGIAQAAVLKRGSHKDILVLHPSLSKRKALYSISFVSEATTSSGKKIKEQSWSLPLKEHPEKSGKMEDIVIATSSIRRIAQWLHHYPDHKIENLRGNVNTRLRKLEESNWHGAIFAAAGLERINLRPENSIELDWMLPAPAQGAIMVVCREDDNFSLEACSKFNDPDTSLATKIERDFLRTLLGGCSTPISALAEVKRKYVYFQGNIVSPDGKDKADVDWTMEKSKAEDLGKIAAQQILEGNGREIIEKIRNATK